MEKVFFVAALFASILASASSDPVIVNENVLKAFNQTFASAKDITWQEYQNYYQVNFKQNNGQMRAQFDNKGRLIRTIRYYGQSQLLPNIVATLNKKFEGTYIIGVTESSSDIEVSFLINLQDAENLYLIKADVLGNLEVKESLKRGDK